MNILFVILIVITVFAIIRAIVLNPGKDYTLDKRIKDNVAVQLRKTDNESVTLPPVNVEVYRNCYSFNVVGMKYRPGYVKKFIDRMDGGEVVELKPDPRNQYDKNAIKVLVYDDEKMEDIFIGYVPADEAKEIGILIEENPNYSCSLENVYCDLDDDFFSISVEIEY